MTLAPLMAQAVETATNEVWRLQTHWTWAPWVTVLVAAAIVALIVACYRYELSPAGATYRTTLGLLRLTTILLLLLMLSEAVFSGSRNGKPRFAIVLDRSASMQRSDVANDGDENTTRIDAAKDLLTAEDAALVRQLAEGYEVELTVVDAAAQSTARNADDVLEQLTKKPTEADDSSTRLGDAIAGLTSDIATAPLQGALILSDGQVTAGRSLSDAAEAARRAGTPLYLVGIGSDQAPAEARLSDLVADDMAFVDDLVTFKATLASRGLAGKPIRVDLFRDGVVDPVATETVTPGSDSGPTAVRLTDRPSDPGEYRYTLRATPLETDNDATPPSELTHALQVRDDQVRVLVAAAYPNYEFRYLKQLLERDETIRVATHLQEADPEHAEADLTALPRMPLRLEALAEYDAMVLIDLDPTLLPRSLWDEVGRFVSERGGGVVLVAGPQNLPGAYRRRSAFAALTPTEVGKATLGGWEESEGFSVLPTPLGQQTPAMELGDTPADSERIWRALPKIYWRADVGPPKPAAQVLATHPTARQDDGGPAALIVSHYYGAGRVLLHAFDSTYRWRYRVGDVYFARYWVQTLRTLARNKRSETAASLELAANKRRYEPGEAVRLRLRDERPGVVRSGPATVVLQTPGQAERRIELAPGGDGGRFETTVRDLPPGRYRALFVESGAEPTVAEFEIVAPLGEDARPEMNRAGLQAAAERSRGTFLTLDEARESLSEVIPRGRPTALETLPPIDLWNRWPLLAGITACLTAEWILRKRRAML